MFIRKEAITMLKINYVYNEGSNNARYYVYNATASENST
jgi:hypothetical protein